MVEQQTSQPVVIIEGLRKTLDDKPVLQGLDLRVEDGECLVVLGRSGEGKSVMLKHIVRLFVPDEGQITVLGERLNELDRQQLFALRKRIGFLFQGSALFDSMTVLENVGFALREHQGIPRSQLRPLVLDYLRQVQLGDILDQYPAELSGGMKRRVALARALAMEPRLLLYDEPTTGIDPVTAAAINALIRSTQRQRNASAILVTHDIASAYTVGDRIALLHRGRIVAVDSVQAMKNSTDPFVRQFLDGVADGPLTENT